MNLSLSKKRYIDQINNLIKLNKISHAYLIELDNYENDFFYVIEFVKKVLCNKVNIDVDNLSDEEKNMCIQVEKNEYIDLRIIEPDGNFIKKKQLLDLQDEFHNKSLVNNKRIYIIKEADKLNDSSANTMLKFLEEPEENIIAILLTTNRYKVIETILSRCQILSMQDNLSNVNVDETLLDLIELIVKKNDLFINYNTIVNEILPDKIIAKSRLEDIEKVFINFLNYISCGDEKFFDKNINKILERVDSNYLISYVTIIELELQKLEYNVNYKLWLDGLFSKLIGG